MNILILDPDLRGNEYMVGLLKSEFPQLRGHFTGSGQQALEALKLKAYDIVLMENSFPDAELFSILRAIRETGTPVIVVGTDTSERLIVELLLAGVSDYVSKRNIKFGYLPSLIRRILHKKSGEGVPALLDEAIRSHVKEDRDERERYQITRGLISGAKSFQDGQSYTLIYLYICLPFFSIHQESKDDFRMSSMRKELMGQLMGIHGKFGGLIWSRKEDMALNVFEANNIMGCLLSTLEMRAAVRMFNLTEDNLNGHFLFRAGITRSRAVYRENHGDIVSDGINLSAHLAFASEQEEAILMTEELYKNLIPRARKYFFKQPPFEGTTVYRYETIA